MIVYENKKEKSREKIKIDSLLSNKLINWIEKRCRSEKTEYAKCHFQEIVKLLGADARHVREIVESACTKGFLRPERYRDFEHYICRRPQRLTRKFSGSTRAFEIRQQVNPLLLHKLVDWLDKRGKTEKTKYIKCDFQEIVDLLGVSTRHARKVVECARNKGFVQTERHGNDYYIYRMKYLERLMGFKRTVWDLYLKHKGKVRDNAPELYKKMVNYIKNCRKKEKSNDLLTLEAVDNLPLGVIEDIFKLLLNLKALYSKNKKRVFDIYGEVTNFLIKMEETGNLKLNYLKHVLQKAYQNIKRFTLPQPRAPRGSKFRHKFNIINII